MPESLLKELTGYASLGALVHFGDLANLVAALVWNVDVLVAFLRTAQRLGVGLPFLTAATLETAYELALVVLLVVTVYRLYDRLTASKSES